MEQENDMIKVYTGHKVQVLYLQGILEDSGISASIRDTFQTGISGGVIDGVPSALDVYILESDLKKARPIVEAFIEKEGDMQ
jgi:hypothetical protein